jgi:hypothetical protein
MSEWLKMMEAKETKIVQRAENGESLPYTSNRPTTSMWSVGRW